MSEASRAVLACVAVLALAACGRQLVVVDAVSGLAIDAEVEELADGRLLIGAPGYDTWSGPAQERVALHPLWVRRFADERIPPRRQPPPPCASCPGMRAR